MKERVAAEELKIGMYVAELDRPWLGTKFLFQGFKISSEEELLDLAECCEFVYVDLEKSAVLPKSKSSAGSSVSTTGSGQQVGKRPAHQRPVEEEITVANTIRDLATQGIADIFTRTRLGKKIEVDEAQGIVVELLGSVNRNADALMLLSNIADIGLEAEAHAVSCSILALTFGRYLGLESSEVQELGMAALLHDVGKTALPPELTHKEGPQTKEEIEQLKRHTILGAEILGKTPGISERVVAVARSHHEQLSGKGYPDHLQGDALSRFPRIIGLLNVYENVTRGRFGRSMPTTDALKYLYLYRDRIFDAELTEQFIQCLGIYPVGSVVELNSGEVGIVISIPPDAHLFPRLLMVKDRDKKPIEPPRILNLEQFLDTGESAENSDYAIRKILPTEGSGVDLKSYLLRETII